MFVYFVFDQSVKFSTANSGLNVSGRCGSTSPTAGTFWGPKTTAEKKFLVAFCVSYFFILVFLVSRHAIDSHHSPVFSVFPYSKQLSSQHVHSVHSYYHTLWANSRNKVQHIKAVTIADAKTQQSLFFFQFHLLTSFWFMLALCKPFSERGQ